MRIRGAEYAILPRGVPRLMNIPRNTRDLGRHCLLWELKIRGINRMLNALSPPNVRQRWVTYLTCQATDVPACRAREDQPLPNLAPPPLTIRYTQIQARLGIAAVMPEGVRSVNVDALGVDFTSLVDLIRTRAGDWGVAGILLCGSFARREVDVASDIDLIVAVEATTRSVQVGTWMGRDIEILYISGVSPLMPSQGRKL